MSLYRIADLTLKINNNIEYKEKEAYMPFIEIDDKKVDIEVDIVKEKQELEFNNEPIYTSIKNIIYEKDGIIYRQMVNSPEYPISCMIQNKNKYGKYKCELYNEKLKKTWWTSDIFNMIGIEYLLMENKVMILHSSFISWNNEGVLFTAPSQTGKSTQANLWKIYENADIINGDKSAIRKIDDKWFAFGLPYAGSSEIYRNEKRKIKAIIVLRQGKENNIKRLSKIEAFKYIYSESSINYWDRKYIEKITDLIEEIVKEIPVFLLSCLPNEDAVKLLKKELEGETND